jgi:PKD repeat protein
VRGAAPLVCSFDASSSIGRSLKYAWNFGDATPVDTHATVQHTFQNIDTYSVSLIVSNIHGIDSTRITIIVLDSSQISFSYEAESLATTCITGRTTYVTTETANSNGAAVMITDNTPVVGDWLEFTFNVPVAGTYDVSVYYKSNNNRGMIQGSIDGVNVGGICDEYGSVAYQVPFNMGNVTFTAGNHAMRFVITGKNSGSSNYNVHIDKIGLSRITSTSARAFVNHGGSLDLRVITTEKKNVVFQPLRSTAGSFSLQIRNITGRKIWEAKNVTSPAIVWRGACASGFYLATITQGDNTITRKFLVEK